MSTLGPEVGISAAELALLREVAAAHEGFYSSLSEDAPDVIALRALARRGYVRFCPYPEEFWVTTPEGSIIVAGPTSS